MNKDIDSIIPKYAFWDVNRENLDLVQDKNFIVSRAFERAKLDDVFTIIALYGQKETAAILEKNKYLDRQALFLAHTVLGIPLENFSAYAFLKRH